MVRLVTVSNHSGLSASSLSFFNAGHPLQAQKARPQSVTRSFMLLLTLRGRVARNLKIVMDGSHGALAHPCVLPLRLGTSVTGAALGVVAQGRADHL